MSLEARLSALATAIGADMAARTPIERVPYMADPTLVAIRDALVAAGIMLPDEAPAAALPVNTVAPVVSGTNQPGNEVTVTTGTWTGTMPITFAYQWRANGVDIPGETIEDLLLDAGDVGASITCRVTATNAAGSVSAVSNAITIEEEPEQPTGDPMAFQAMTPAGNITLENNDTRHRRTSGTGYTHTRLTRPVSGKRYLEFICRMGQDAQPAVVNIYNGAQTSYPTGSSLGQWWNEPGVAVGLASRWSVLLFSHYGDANPAQIANSGAWDLPGNALPISVRVRVAIDSATRQVWIDVDNMGWYGNGDPATGETPTLVMQGSSSIYAGGTSGAATNWVDVVQVAEMVGPIPAGFTPGV